jgi:membrane protease YdiL (CAAX protease family)
MKENSLEITPELLEQNPWLAIALTGMSAFVVAVLMGFLASWVFLIVKARRGEPWLTAEPRLPRVWGLADLAVVVVLVVSCQTLFASAYVRLAGVDLAGLQGKAMPAAVSAMASSGNVLAIALTLGWLALRFQVSPSHVGFRSQGWIKQLQIGTITTLATLPIVYMLMAAVSIGMDTAYKHPLLDEIRATATVGSYLLGVLTAVLLAPLAEEFLFRVMLQGWMQSWSVSSLSEIILGASSEQRVAARMSAVIMADVVPETPATLHTEAAAAELSADSVPPALQPTALQPITLQPITSPHYDLTAATPPQTIAESQPDGNLVDGLLARTPPVWPSLITGILFGLAHWGYGLSFVPLIILGIVLGLVYRATNSIWPCFFIHLALNATSMLGLGLSILVERADLVAQLSARLGLGW